MVEEMKRRELGQRDVAFEIRFALGQMGASHFIRAHSKSPEVRLRALEAMTALIAERFASLEVTGPPPRTGPLFGSSRPAGD